ncbi:recombinase family protein [Salipiger sp. PrR007]|uniref:recombinase family protein n=1 Tax=Salipiger sp. PrR007 TaxID=2706884 RepID=UPI00351B2810
MKQTSDGSGLSSQERTCRDYAERNGYEVVEVFTDVISGKFEDRPGMNALLAFLGKVSTSDYVVVVDDFSRLARDVKAHASLRDKITATQAIIESPNQKIGEDATGRFVETIWAAIAEHQRLQNAEQSRRRSLARLKNGYWIFRPPYGYRYEKTSHDGKRLVPDEPLASIVREALEGFAAGRFQSQAEVKRFLDTKPEFPKSYRGTEVHFDKVKRLLTNPLYAGYLEHEKSEIPLIEAKHEPLISYSTHQIILDRLSERSVAPARKDISEEFPLRGFLICECCGHRLTSCWSKSRSGTKYPYYLCGYRGCAEKGKSIPRDKLEAEFSEGLKRLVPARTTFELAERMFREAWDERSRSSATESQRLNTKIRQIERDVEKLLKRLVETQNNRTISAYENRIDELEREKILLREEADRTSGPQRPFDEMFEHSMRFLANPYEIWKKGDTPTKRTVIRLIYPSPLTVSRKTGVRTGETTYPFKALGFLERSDLKMVPPHGLEPRTY